MEKLISLSQLKVGTRLKIVAKSEKYSHKSISVKKLIKMWSGHGDGSVYGKQDTEILVNRSKNHYFSMNAYLDNNSGWVKECFVLDGIDKRLKREARKLTAKDKEDV